MSGNNRSPRITPEDQLGAQHQLDQLIAKFVNPAPGRPADNAHTRIRHWLAVANNPSVYTADQSPKALANLRRKALQNVRRLGTRHPDAVAVVMAQSSQQSSQGAR